MPELGLALGGGGSKGIFQMGAWKAFIELGIDFDAITGVSIGAVNGAYMVGTDFDRAMEMWQNLKIDQCLSLSQKIKLASDDLLSRKNANILARELFSQRGIDTQPLHDLLSRYVSEEAMRKNRDTKYGLLTTLVPTLKAEFLWLEHIPQGQLTDYLLASTHLPGLEPVKINGKRYLDGGVIENVPVSMLRQQGYRDIIAVDLGSRPALRHPIDDNTRITYIHDKEELGGFLDVTPSVLQRNYRLGYLDTLKAFSRLNGEYYAFDPKQYRRLLERWGIHTVRGLEQAALIFEIDRGTIYTASNFLTLIRKQQTEMSAEYAKKRQSMKIDTKLSALASDKLRRIDLSPAMRLAFLLEIQSNPEKRNYLEKLPSRLFGHILAAAHALYQISDQGRQ